MAPKVTSSRDRAGRKPAKPPVVTTSKGRANRSSVSQAKVTDGSNGKPASAGARITNAGQRTNTGSARVTGGSRPALPPGARGGQVTTRGSSVTPPRPNGGPVRPVSVRDLGNNKPAQVGGGRGASLPPGQRGASAPARPGGAPRLPGGGRAPIGMGGLRGGLLLAAGTAAADYVGTKAGNAIGTAIRQASKPKVTGTRTGRTGRGGTTNDVGGNPARDGRYIPGSQQVDFKDRSGRPKPPSAPTLPASVRSSTSGGSSGSSTRASSPTGRSSSAPKPPSTTGSSKPQDNSAPKPPTMDKVETTTTDAPKPPTISSPALAEMKARRGVGRDEMIQDNLRRARRKKV